MLKEIFKKEKCKKFDFKWLEINGDTCRNPCTTFHKLIEAIKSF